MKTSLLYVLAAIFLVALLFPISGCQDQADKSELDKFRTMAKVHEQNKAIVRELFGAIDNGKFEKLDELLSDDFALNAPGLPQPWKKGELFQAVKAHYAAFPDWTHTIESLVAEGDNIAVKLMQQGTHKAQYEGIAASGKSVTNPAMHLMTILNGKVKQWWALEDNLGFMQQLGMELKPTKARSK